MKNTGSRTGEDSVLLFATDLVRRVEPRYKMLKGFDKVSLEPGESKKVPPPFPLKKKRPGSASFVGQKHALVEGEKSSRPSSLKSW